MKILFICMGNICRSPTAEGVFRKKAESAGLLPHLTIDSAGTHNYHPGEPPDARSQAHAKRRGYDLSDLRARAVTERDVAHFDLLIVMDELNRSTLLGRIPPEHHPKVRLMMEFAHGADDIRVREVPDPYYGEREDFERVLDLVEEASDGLLQFVRERVGR